MLFQAKQFSFEFPRPAVIMGIVNVTPDSFSDGGACFDVDTAVARGVRLVEEGAEILDIGGESTRPGAAPVEEAEERRRVIPVIERLVREVNVPISIDTMKPSVARAALEAGASIVNDVAASHRPVGFSSTSDGNQVPIQSSVPRAAADDMWCAVAESNAGYVCMHMQGTPQTMQLNPQYDDVVSDVHAFFSDRLGRLNNCGVRNDQVIVDVGIGFGKTLEHNLQLLAGLGSFRSLERPILLGVSRKSFIAKLLGSQISSRVPASIACAVMAVAAGVQLIRTHDVADTVQAIRMAEAILARKK